MEQDRTDDPEPLELPIDGVLDLHTFQPREVKDLLPHYLAECRKRGILQVRVIHGKGSGTLREIVHAILDRLAEVVSYRLAGENGGGWGATIVILKRTERGGLMKAMMLKRLCDLEVEKAPLDLVDLPVPVPKEKEILVRVSACGVCHTELDEIEGRTPPRLPVIPGHQVVGRVADLGRGAGRFTIGDRVGIAWIYSACGKCRACSRGMENLCPGFKATGRDADGGYAEYMTVPEDFTYPIPDIFADAEAAPLLCAGAIGYRSLRLTGLRDGENLGLTGFGASAHLVMKTVRSQYPHSKIFVFSRTPTEREFAGELGASWSGDIGDEPPEKLHAAIDTTPAWRPVVETLKNLEAGGRLVINVIRKEERDKESLLALDYSRHLWMEKEIRSVANITRRDVTEFLRLAALIPIRPEIQEFRLDEANKALIELKERKIRGAKVLRIA